MVAAAGDMNCDGQGDLALGQPRFNFDDRGRVQVHLGSSAGVLTTPHFSLNAFAGEHNLKAPMEAATNHFRVCALFG